MDLILWRHAEAEYGIQDLARALTPHGEKQARVMARWLREHLPEGTRVLVSPARRTQQTAASLARDFETVEALAPGAEADAVLAACAWAPHQPGAVLVVGHQPTLGEVAGRLLGLRDGVAVRKGAVWWFTGRDRVRSPVVLTACLPPSLLPD